MTVDNYRHLRILTKNIKIIQCDDHELNQSHRLEAGYGYYGVQTQSYYPYVSTCNRVWKKYF